MTWAEELAERQSQAWMDLIIVLMYSRLELRLNR